MPKIQTRSKKPLIIALIVVVFAIMLPTGVLAYAGFVPGITSSLGVNKPVDLGVSYTAADFQQFQKSTLSSVSNFDGTTPPTNSTSGVAPGTQLVITGANTVQANVSQQELTAFFNMLPWTTSPLSHSQVRLQDGALEYSGNIKAAYLSDLIQTLYPQDNEAKMSPLLRMAGHLYNPAIYAKFNVSATSTTNGPANGQLRLKILALKVNRLDLTDKVSNMHELVVRIPEGSYEKGIAYSVSTLNITDGTMRLYGTVPAEYSVGGGDPTVICNTHHGSALVSLSPVDGRIGSTVAYCN